MSKIEEMRRYLEALCKEFRVKLETRTQQDGKCWGWDMEIEAVFVLDGWVEVFVRSGLYVTSWWINELHHIPGPWQDPPDVDIIEHGPYASVTQVAREAVCWLVLRHRVEQVIEDVGQYLYAEQEEQARTEWLGEDKV